MWTYLFGVLTGFIISHYSLAISKGLKKAWAWVVSLKDKFSK